jgi:hypothetical protein
MIKLKDFIGEAEPESFLRGVIACIREGEPFEVDEFIAPLTALIDERVHAAGLRGGEAEASLRAVVACIRDREYFDVDEFMGPLTAFIDRRIAAARADYPKSS